MVEGTVSRYTNDLQLAVRAYLNEGGKLLFTGKNAGLPYFSLAEYHPTGDVACDPRNDGDGCLNLQNDFLQYYLSAYGQLDNVGTAPDGKVHGVIATDGPLAGLELALGSGSGAANQDHSMGLMHTSRYMPAETFPQFKSQRAAYYDNPALAPHSGDKALYSQYVPRAYQRLLRTVDLTGATAAQLDFWTSMVAGTNPDRGFLVVEAHTVGQEDWTTLPDLNGHTNQNLPANCPMYNTHPQLRHYLTQETMPARACKPTGTTGAWNAAGGNTGGWQNWSVDLAAYAGKQVELSISFVASTARLGAFLDDVTLKVGDQTDTATFEADDAGAWTIAGAPQGSPANQAEMLPSTATAVPVSAIVTTEDTAYLGFGFEAIAGVRERTEVMCRLMDYLLGGTLACAHPVERPPAMYLPLTWKSR